MAEAKPFLPPAEDIPLCRCGPEAREGSGFRGGGDSRWFALLLLIPESDEFEFPAAAAAPRPLGLSVSL